MPRLLCALLSLLLCTSPLLAQQVTPKGTEAGLEIATWNIEWFGAASNGPTDDTQQFENVVDVILGAGIDLWAVQEIADLSDWDALLAALGDGYAGDIATQHSGQRVGFIYDTSVIQVRSIGHVLTNFSSEFASRPPLELEANVILGDTTVVMTFITIHMKAFSDTASYDRRLSASQRLKNHIDFSSRSSKNVVVLGDYNDELTDSITSNRISPYDNFLQDTADYFFPSLDLEVNRKYSWCGNSTSCSSGSTIDHILITNELVPAYVQGSADHYDELLSELSSYVFSTSDHLPVFAQFTFPTATATEGLTLPLAATLGGVHPNPAAGRVTVPYTLDHRTSVRLEVFDMLGRQVATLADAVQPAGSHAATFDVAPLPTGIYLVRLQAGLQATSRMLVRMP